MKLSEIYKSDKTSVSFEIFPPETTEQIEKLFNEIKILKDFNPVFISLTCGAAGKNNENYKTVLKKLKTDFQIDIMPHFTCMCNKKVFIDDNLEFIKSLGTENISSLFKKIFFPTLFGMLSMSAVTALYRHQSLKIK